MQVIILIAIIVYVYKKMKESQGELPEDPKERKLFKIQKKIEAKENLIEIYRRRIEFGEEIGFYKERQYDKEILKYKSGKSNHISSASKGYYKNQLKRHQLEDNILRIEREIALLERQYERIMSEN